MYLHKHRIKQRATEASHAVFNCADAKISEELNQSIFGTIKIFCIVTLQIKCQNMCCIFTVIKSYLNLLSEQNVLCDVMYWCVVNFALFNTPLYFIHTLSINSVHDIHV